MFISAAVIISKHSTKKADLEKSCVLSRMNFCQCSGGYLVHEACALMCVMMPCACVGSWHSVVSLSLRRQKRMCCLQTAFTMNQNSECLLIAGHTHAPDPHGPVHAHTYTCLIENILIHPEHCHKFYSNLKHGCMLINHCTISLNEYQWSRVALTSLMRPGTLISFSLLDSHNLHFLWHRMHLFFSIFFFLKRPTLWFSYRLVWCCVVISLTR